MNEIINSTIIGNNTLLLDSYPIKNTNGELKVIQNEWRRVTLADDIDKLRKENDVLKKRLNSLTTLVLTHIGKENEREFNKNKNINN